MIYSFIIRRAGLNDAASIKEVMDDSFGLYKTKILPLGELDVLNETEEDIRNDIKSKEVFLALIDDMPVGSIRISIEDEGSAMISRFGVKQQYHNIGIGKALLNLADKYLQSKHIQYVKLYTASRYGDLMRFYYGRGFYVHSTTTDKGYIRALMIKEYT
jgi:ribosomal protein S18 acetylase RimI-like enzyme